MNRVVVISKKKAREEIRRDRSRTKILKAAENEFARDGIAGARMDQIATEAGVNKALLYYYFTSKESLYEAVIERHFREFNDRALGLLNGDGPVPELLLQYVDVHFDFISRRHRHAQLFQQFMMRGGKSPERLVRDYVMPRTQALQALLARGIREGALRKSDPFHTAVSIASMIVFYFSAAPMLKLLGHTKPFAAAQLAKRKKEVADMIRHGLFTDAGGKAKS